MNSHIDFFEFRFQILFPIFRWCFLFPKNNANKENRKTNKVMMKINPSKKFTVKNPKGEPSDLKPEIVSCIRKAPINI